MDDARGWWFQATLLLVLGLALASHELGTAPLEYHEAYVVQSAQEMSQRGSWIVPYFNDQPRLRKPPLSYWATALAGRVSGHPHLRPADGRFPSALAGVGILALVLWMGSRFYDRRTALLAGVMLITSVGYFHYTHGARSDMLYAFWAMAGVAAFAASVERAEQGRSTRGTALVMWVCFALGTLTKGPQVPAMFLFAFGAWAAVERVGWRRALETFRPVSGLVVFLALTVPWWMAVERAAGTAGVERAQLEGSLLRPGTFKPDYLYRIPQLVLPWAVLLPVVTALEWGEPERGRTTRLLAMVIGVTFLAFSFGSQHRAVYMLPLVGPSLLLLAAGTSRVMSAGGENPRLRRLLGWAVRGGSLVILGALILLLGMAPRIPDLPPGTTLRVAVTALLALTVYTLVLARSLDAWSGLARIVALASIAYGSFWILGGTTLQWTRGKVGAEEFGRLAAASTPADRDILAWDTFPDPFVFYARRPIQELTERDQVLAELRRAPSGLVVLAKTNALNELPDSVRVEVLHRQTSYWGRDVSLVRLSLPGSRMDAVGRGDQHARVGRARESS